MELVPSVRGMGMGMVSEWRGRGERYGRGEVSRWFGMEERRVISLYHSDVAADSFIPSFSSLSSLKEVSFLFFFWWRICTFPSGAVVVSLAGRMFVWRGEGRRHHHAIHTNMGIQHDKNPSYIQNADEKLSTAGMNWIPVCKVTRAYQTNKPQRSVA